MKRYRTCTNCHATIELDHDEGWKICPDCNAISCRSCRVSECHACRTAFVFEARTALTVSRAMGHRPH